MFRRYILQQPNDPIAPGASGGAGGGGNAAGGESASSAPAATPDPANAPVGRAELQQFGAALVGAMQNLSQQVARPAPRNEPAPAPKDPGTEILTRFAGGDLSPVDQRVRQVLQDSGVANYLGSRAQADAAANEANARTAIENEFGAGAFDELKPIIDAQLGDGIAARSLPQAWDNALAYAKGQRFQSLAERAAKKAEATRAAEAAAEKARMNAPWMPGNGTPPQFSERLDEHDATLMQKIASKTGGRVPTHKVAAQLRDLAFEKGPSGVSMEDIDALGIQLPS